MEVHGYKQFATKKESLETVAKHLISRVTPTDLREKLEDDVATDKTLKRESIMRLVEHIMKRAVAYDIFNAEKTRGGKRKEREHAKEDEVHAPKRDKREKRFKPKYGDGAEVNNNKRSENPKQKTKEIPYCLNKETCDGERHYMKDCPNSNEVERKELLAKHRQDKQKGNAERKGAKNGKVRVLVQNEGPEGDEGKVLFRAVFDGNTPTMLKADTLKRNHSMLARSSTESFATDPSASPRP